MLSLTGLFPCKYLCLFTTLTGWRHGILEGRIVRAGETREGLEESKNRHGAMGANPRGQKADGKG